MDHEVTWSLSDHGKKKVEDILGEKKKNYLLMFSGVSFSKCMVNSLGS